MSRHKELYKSYIDDYDSEDFEHYLADRIVSLETALEAILDAASILDYKDSSNSVQLKAFAEFARQKAKQELGR